MEVDFRKYQIRSAEVLSDSDVLSLAEQVVDEKLSFQDVFRSNQQTFIGRFFFGQRQLILKIPRGRNRRYWERCLTLIRRGESARVFDGMLKLRELGFLGPTPVIAAECRRLGVVVESFLIYEYLEGSRPKPEEAQAVLDTLLRLHRFRYTRRDAKLDNFVRVGDAIAMIDFRLKKPILFSALQCHLELAKFLRACPNKQLVLPNAVVASYWYKTAVRLDRLLWDVRSFRRKLKGRLISG